MEDMSTEIINEKAEETMNADANKVAGEHQNGPALKIDNEFQSLISPLSDEEYETLEQNIVKYGCRDPITIWKGQDIIVDGHNRYKICTERGLNFETHEIEFAAREDAINYIIDNQLGRRNISAQQKSYLRGKRYNNEKKAAHRPEKGDHSDHLKTSERIAKESGASPATIRRDAEFAEAVDKIKEDVSPEFGKNLLNNGSKLSKKEVIALSNKAPNDMKALAEEIDKGAKRLSEAEEKVQSRQEVPHKPTFEKADGKIELARWTWCPRMSSESDYLDAPCNTPVPSDAAIEVSLQTVLVSHESDIFGEGTPQEWIEKVLATIGKAPQWTFLFIPNDLKKLAGLSLPKNAWIGATIDSQEQVQSLIDALKEVNASVRFVCCEPLDGPIEFPDMPFNWLVVGGSSKSGKSSVKQPKWQWVKSLLLQTAKANIPVYFKGSITVKPEEYPNNDMQEQAPTDTIVDEGEVEEVTPNVGQAEIPCCESHTDASSTA